MNQHRCVIDVGHAKACGNPLSDRISGGILPPLWPGLLIGKTSPDEATYVAKMLIAAITVVKALAIVVGAQGPILLVCLARLGP